MESFEKERRAVFGQETGIVASFGMDLIIPRARAMDTQYYKRLAISVSGIYVMYLTYGLIQEKM